MAANPIYLEQPMSRVTCCYENCGVTFAVPATIEGALRKSHEWFYCPHGHKQQFGGQSEEEKLRWQLQNKNDELQRARFARDTLLAERDRLRTRVKKGQCPASRRCKARFENLQQHLKQHHPRHPWRTK